MEDGMIRTGSRWMVGLLVLMLALPAWADDDHDVARELRQQGKVLPLSEILQRAGVNSKTDQVLEVELERKNGRLVYEIETLGRDGVVRKRLFDAKSGKPLPADDDD